MARRTAEGPWTWQASKRSLAGFASFLAGRLDQPVKDATGLTGVYEFTLRWVEADVPVGSLINPLAVSPTDDSGPTIFEAVQKQLGLKLASAKISVHVFVVDHVEKAPIEN